MDAPPRCSRRISWASALSALQRGVAAVGSIGGSEIIESEFLDMLSELFEFLVDKCAPSRRSTMIRSSSGGRSEEFDGLFCIGFFFAGAVNTGSGGRTPALRRNSFCSATSQAGTAGFGGDSGATDWF